MTYATQQDLIDRADNGERTLIELTDRAQPPLRAVNAVVVAKALGDADALIEPFLAARYAVPLATVPKLVNLIACDIALHNLYGNRANEGVKAAYEEAMKLLRDIAAGRVTLGLDALNIPATTNGGGSAQSFSSGRTFNADTLAGFV